MRLNFLLRALVPLVMTSSCAWLHHVQVGEIDNSGHGKLRAFELKVSESGINFEEAGRIAKSLNGSAAGRKDVDNITNAIGMFQMGPRTGNIVFNDTYAKNIVNDIYKECPSGQVTGLVSIRESRKYPVISGEIIKIKGYCVTGGSATKSASAGRPERSGGAL